MLIRVGGGTGGIKVYLEQGQKQGRGQSRDELDERIILAGDLEVTDLLIEASQSSGEKYLHITLSFKEDTVSRETLQDITDEFRRFALTAYRDDEYNFYAEAHLPRIKGYHDAKSGTLVERKPHIHIIIPKENYLSGTHLNPLGVVDHNLRYIDAWQEHINDKHGLASPKDNRRVEFTSESEVISRYKGDLFDAQGKALKTQLLDTMLERDIRNLQGFHAMLEEFGQRRTRNAGKSAEYENLKPPNAARGVNLKDWVFSRAFIELDLAAKRERLAADLRPRYEAAGQPRTTSADRLQSLQEWAHTRTREIKYLNSGNRRAWREYQAADPATRCAMLDAREQRFYARHDPQESDRDRQPRTQQLTAQPADATRQPWRQREWERNYPLKNGRPEPGQPAGRGGRPGGQHELAAAASLAQAESLDGLRDLSSLDVDGLGQDGDQLLPRDAAGHLGHRQADRAEPLRRHAPGRAKPGLGGAGSSGRGSDSLVGQLLHDGLEQRIGQAADQVQQWRDIKAQIDARGLLADLSKSHGLQVDKYEVVQGRDGADRIRCGRHHLNVSDFLTKEMHLPWIEAQALLRGAWQRQREVAPDRQAMAAPNPALWAEFARQRRLIVRVERAVKRRQTGLAATKSRQAITQAFQAARTQAGALPAAQRRAQLSLARMRRIAAQAQLKDTLAAQRAQGGREGRRPVLDHYRLFLQERAQLGSEAALHELRRLAPPRPVDPAQQSSWILAGNDDDARKARHALYGGLGLSYSVASNGDVTYQLQGRALIRDTARKIDVLSDDTKTLETALRLAQQKFGSTLVLSGSRGFEDKIARAAAEGRLGVRFADERLNRVMRARAVELQVPVQGDARGRGPELT